MLNKAFVTLISGLLIGSSCLSAEPRSFGQMLMNNASGEWREYRIAGGPSDGAVLRWAFLETEERNGEPYQWLEMQMAADDIRIITRTLVNRDTPEKPPIAAIIKHGEQPAVEMPAEMIQQSLSGLPVPSAPRRIGPATVNVPAGRFETTAFESEFEGQVTRLYVSESVGLILTEGAGPDGKPVRMELTAAGAGATSALGRTP